MEIVELVQNNMLDYSSAVNQSRAIPDARTGLKPIHRKIIYEMYADKIKSSGKYKKCAYMVGQIIARFSEHGDAATYDALVRLAQPWIQRYPLLDFHGNYGSQFGDDPAAMRYTEAKLSSLVEDGFLCGLNKNNVDWMLNFTNEEKEPTTLPAIFPGLFCLPNQGIGYAVACNFLTYNLQEVSELIYNYINTGTLGTINYDLASGGIIVNPQVMSQIHSTGKGSVIVEAKYHINDNKIIVTELPFNVMFEDVYDEIVEFCESEDNLYITNLENNSGNGKLELIIECNLAAHTEKAIDVLMAKTKLRSSYGVNQIALVDNQPKMLTLKDMVEIYINHNLSCIVREYEYDKAKALHRLHIIEGLIKAVNNIDEVISIIRTDATPQATLKKTFDLDDEQIKAILDMKLARLSKLETEKLVQEKKEKEEIVARCEYVLSHEDEQKAILCARLLQLANKFSTPRRTQIVQKEIAKTSAKKSGKTEFIPEDVVVEVTDNGYLKVIPMKSYRVSKNKFFSMKTQNDDYVKLFSNKGKMFRVPLKTVKMCGSSDKGIALGSILQMDMNEKILFADLENNSRLCDFVVFVTKSGMVKKTDSQEYSGTTGNLRGLKAINLKDRDEVVYIDCGVDDNCITVTTETHNIYFSLNDVSYQGKAAGGVKGINTDNHVVTATIGENKKLTLQKRGGKGTKI